jgi:GNAT superfamily N-acetyltransferase
VTARPDGYPRAFERVVRLRDGRRVQIAPIVAEDAPELVEAIHDADAETLRARFLGGPPPLTPKLLDELTRVDYVTHFALVARWHGHGIAIARYIAEGAGSAEVAVVVAPEWRRLGLATALVQLLAERAAECGVTTFTATYYAGNRPVAELATEGSAHVVIADGIAEMAARLPLDPGEKPES